VTQAGDGRTRTHLVTSDPHAVEAFVRQLPTAARLLRGFTPDPEPWDLSGADVRCVGVVRSREDLEAALVCAARGVWVVAAAPDEALLVELFRDLRRLGPVEHWTSSAKAAPANPLDPDQEALLQLLAGGASVAEAATRLFLSQRTAERRLAAARRSLGVGTTAEAVVAFMATRS
jgi:DNA-binding NarL/FixJ family response regulator